jgi:hypothetical protein
MKTTLAITMLLGMGGMALAQYKGPYGLNQNNSYRGSGTGSNPNSHYVQPYTTFARD